MTNLSPKGLDIQGDAYVAAATFMQVHTGDPGASGTANVSTAARKACAFTSVNGAIALSATVAFTGGAASGSATWVTLWDAVTAGNWLGNFAITTGDTSFNAAGALNVTALNITGS